MVTPVTVDDVFASCFATRNNLQLGHEGFVSDNLIEASSLGCGETFH